MPVPMGISTRPICQQNIPNLADRYATDSSAQLVGVLSGWRRIAMQDFIERTNIANVTERLETENDPTKRTLLVNLLAEEEAKHASHPKQDK
jgi:hypothetical protein